MEYNIEEIQKVLPHRYPFLLIDRVTACVPGEMAEAYKCVSGNEGFFQGHFPGKPVMPGVLIIEALAQTGAFALLSVPENSGKLVIFGGIKRARFRKMVVPGDLLSLKCDIITLKGPVGSGKAVAKVGDEIAAEAELTFAVIDRE